MENSQSQNTNNLEHDNIKLLLEYKELLDSGIISQEEFDAKKKELLDAPSATPENPSNANSNAASTEIPAASPEIPATPRGMKWHNFLVKFGLRAQSLILLIAGIILAALPFVADISEFHNMIDSIIDIPLNITIAIVTIMYVFSGLLLALAALLSSSARKNLLEYKEAGQGFLLLSSYGWMLVTHIPISGALYCDQVQSIFDVSEEMIYATSACGALLLMAFAMTFIFGNLSYYKKRKHLFTP